jgi:hypothetical protein
MGRAGERADLCLLVLRLHRLGDLPHTDVGCGQAAGSDGQHAPPPLHTSKCRGRQLGSRVECLAERQLRRRGRVGGRGRLLLQEAVQDCADGSLAEDADRGVRVEEDQGGDRLVEIKVTQEGAVLRSVSAVVGTCRAGSFGDLLQILQREEASGKPGVQDSSRPSAGRPRTASAGG